MKANGYQWRVMLINVRILMRKSMKSDNGENENINEKKAKW